MCGDNFYYNEFGAYLRGIFGCKVQKITLDGGFTCPNRDGKVGRGGCTYCNNQTFNPAYCHRHLPVKEQMLEGISFFAHKYPLMRYLAYFQAYTNTYDSLDNLKHRYEEALSVDGCVGLVIGTRPDCMPDELLDYLQALGRSTFVLVEYGIESVNDATLLRVNRGHDYACAADAVERTAARGIPVGAHMILGLPGEDRTELMRQATVLSQLPLTTTSQLFKILSTHSLGDEHLTIISPRHIILSTPLDLISSKTAFKAVKLPCISEIIAIFPIVCLHVQLLYHKT